jgi:para-nitrobenzyl esterase
MHTAEHLTPEYVHQPRYLNHANGARRLASVTPVVADHELPAYIAAFGGDPQQVTLAGQSAGALSTVALLPQVNGLVRRVILHSDAAGAVPHTPTEATACAEQFLYALDLTPATAHRLRNCRSTGCWPPRSR